MSLAMIRPRRAGGPAGCASRRSAHADHDDHIAGANIDRILPAEDTGERLDQRGDCRINPVSDRHEVALGNGRAGMRMYSANPPSRVMPTAW